MIIQCETTGDIKGFESIIKKTISSPRINGLLLLSCDENHYSKTQVDHIIELLDIPVFGGIFPSIVYENKILNKGTVAIGLSNVLKVETIPELSNNGIDYESLLDEKIPNMETGKTMMVFVDAFSKRISAFIESLFIVFGLDINYIVGGAGFLSMQQKPCLFTNQGLLEDCAVIALLDAHSSVGVNHGWHILEGPFQVTESDRNTIKTLDWQPAFEVYHKIVSLHSERLFTIENFFEISKAYPFGIMRLNNEMIVRDPIQAKPDKSLVCVGEIPAGSFVSILNGDKSSLIQAAGKAMDLCVNSFPKGKPMGMLFLIDCISRVLFLEDQFSLELEAVHHLNLPMAGACTLGEIANSGSEFLEFYNKTNVVAILEKWKI
jgi:hypothetical protein